MKPSTTKTPVPTDIIVKYLKEHPQAKDISDEQMKKLELYADQHLPKYITNVRDIEPQLIALVDIAFVNKPLGWLFKPFAMPHVKVEINKIINNYRENQHKHRGYDDTDNKGVKHTTNHNDNKGVKHTTINHNLKRTPSLRFPKERRTAIIDLNKAIKKSRKSKIQVKVIKNPK
jgi:hypothetical protein